MNKKNTYLVLAIIFSVIIFVLGFLLFTLPQEDPVEEKIFINESGPKEETEEIPELKLYFVGDIMLDRGVLHYIKKNNDWKWPFLKIADDLKQADLVFGNLESMISDKGYDLGGKYSFRAPPQTIKGLVYAGFDVLSVANNHSFDYGIEAFTDTLNRLKKENILYAGGGINKQEAHSAAIKEINDTKIGFLAYANVGSPGWQAAENRPGIAWMDWASLDVLENDIRQAKKISDILIVSFHFGEEYQKQPNENQKLLANAALEAGADIIAGHHPHVVQPLKKDEKGIIAYSLGNFIFDQYFSEETMRGAILKIIVKEKEIIEAKIINTRLNSQYQAEIIR